MKLKSQLIISIAIFGIILLIISTSVIITNQQAVKITNEQQTSGQIQTGASNLAYISNDYFLYQDNAQVNQWQTQFSSMFADLSKINSTNPEQATQVNNVETDLQLVGAGFNNSISLVESTPQNGQVPASLKTVSDQLAVENQQLAYAAYVLANSFENQANQLKQTNNILIFTLLGAFAAYFVMIYLLVFRRTFRSITKLQEGTKIIGSGNLDYTIASTSNDEIGELSSAFDQMAANLKTVTASKSDLEQARSSLQKSEQRWATTLASIGDAVIATDTSGKIMFMNGAAEELTGWKLSEASQKQVKEVFNIVNEQTRLEVENPIDKVLREGIVVGLANHTVLIKKDGSVVPIDDSGAPIKDKDGNTTGVVLIFRDIAERKKAEEEITRLASFPTLNPNPIVEMNFEGKIEYINPAAKAMFADLETLGLNHPFFASWKSVTKVFTEKTANAFACEVKVGDDWYLQSYSNVPNAQRIRVYAINITESKQAEEAIKRQAELIDLSPDAIIIQRLDGTISFWSRGAENLYGWTKDEALGQNIHKLLKTEFRQPLDEILNKVKLDGKWSGELIHISKDGCKVAEQSFWLARFGADGQIVEMLESNVDITDRIELQAKLEESAVRVEEYANQMEDLAEKRAAQLKDAERLATIGATAGMVGHDIRNPLQAITGDVFLAKTDLIAMPESEEKNNIQENLSEIEKNVDYINKIVSDLQDYTKALRPVATEINLEKFMDELIAKNRVAENVKVHVKVQKEADTLMSDPDILKRIVGNLVINAVQAMPKGGKLSIKAYKEANDSIITVADTGVGIPDDVKDKLFTPLFTTKSKGQGFGLAVVKRMTEALGGTVSFDSEEGKGTTFIIRLPPPEELNGKFTYK